MDETRDMAIRSESKIDQHMVDCARVRDAIFKKFEDMSEDFNNIREDIKKQNWLLALIFGGLIVATKIPDLIGFIHATSH